MLKTIGKITKYPRLTLKYPKKPMDNSLFLGAPEIDKAKCTLCGECEQHCPSRAIVIDKAAFGIGINLDECIFCALCADVCETGAARISSEFELAQKDRGMLRVAPPQQDSGTITGESLENLEDRLAENIKRKFGRSLQIREVDAGSCNGCDYEANALNNPFNDVERLGVHFVASPRHADMLLVTGCVTRNMEQALIKTYNATPDPKLVVAVGACACSGGIFRDAYATRCGIGAILPVDVYIPGCPPRPQAIMHGILKAINRIK